MSLVGFQAPKIWMFFLSFFFFFEGGIYCGASFEIILKSPVFGFCDSLPYGLEKSKELRPLISWLLGL